MNSPQNRTKQSGRSRRSGTAYIIVLGASLLIASFAMAGLLSIRVERNSLRDSYDRQQAILNAQAGLDLALYKIRENRSGWRSMDWGTLFSADTRFSLTLTDPVDGDITDSDSDPVVLIVSGTAGDAIQKLRIRLEPDITGYDSMQSAIHSADGIDMQQTSLTGSGSISADNLIAIESSTSVQQDASSSSLPVADGSSQFLGTTGSRGTWPRAMPTSSSVISEYSSGATTINLSSLYLSDHDEDRITNSLFFGLANWIGLGCRIAEGTLIAYTGSRTGDDTGIAQDVTSLIYDGDRYRLEASVFNLNSVACDGLVHLRVETSSGVQFFSTSPVECEAGQWTRLSGDVSPTWTGTLVSVHWMVTLQHDTIPASSIEYAVFDPDLFDQTYPDQAYVLRNQLLSPEANPFGAATSDGLGVYTIDCAGNQVIVTDSRIHGTLVLQNSSNAAVTGSVAMQSAGRNYPVILASDNLTIDTSADSLEEQAIRVNLNPSDSPYIRVANSDQADVYPCRIKGLVYAGGKITFGGTVGIDGLVLAGNVEADNATVDLTYDERYYYEPPPGFSDNPDMVVAPGGIRQYVD